MALRRRCAGALSSLLRPPQQQWSTTSSSRSSSSISTARPGLFGISLLSRPADFPAWAADTIGRCNELVAQVLAAPPDAGAVRLVDDISDAICQVYDSAECCRNIHPDPSWQRAATQACQSLSEYLADINHHQGLHNKLADVQAAYEKASQAAGAAAAPSAGGLQQQQQQQQQDSSSSRARVPLLSRQQLADLCPDTLIVAAKYRQDFEKFGIHLQDAGQRADVARLLAQQQHFPALFNATLADQQELGSVSIPANQAPRGWVAGTSASSLLRRQVAVPLDAGSIHQFLALADSEDARKQVYLAGATSPEANLGLLDHILATRHELARLLGYESYAVFKAADGTLAGTPAAAEGFLKDLAEGCREHADRELAGLIQLKRTHTGNTDAQLQPWDQEFFTRQLAAGKPHIQAAAAASPYLQLGSILAGVDALLRQLMGLRLQLQPLAPGEGWAPGVLKLEVSCQDLGPLGVLFLDLLVRPGKVAANGILYPLRCGRALPGGDYQQPLLCLVGNLSASSGAGTVDPTALLLTWREFRTLMHEMGHAVHSLVSRTRYQHVWGTRCSQDLVEVPSHLWEHFTSHPASLALLARHKGSREPLPSRLAEHLCQGSAMFSSVTPALELQQQTLLSLIDLVYHGPTPPPPGGSTNLWHQVAGSYLSLLPPRHVCPQARFSHLTIYGASYYSYLYARCISEALWERHFADDPLNPDAGQRIRKLLLEPGGAMEPMDLLTNALGGPSSADEVMLQRHGGWCPRPEPLLRSIAAK